MDVIERLLPILIASSLTGLVVAVGLDSTRDELFYVLRRPALLLKAFVAVDVIPPVAAFLLVSFLPLTPIAKTCIVLMAITPVPALVPGKGVGVGARKEHAYGVYVAMSLLSIVTVPLVFALAVELAGRDARVPVSTVAARVLMNVVVPLAVGRAVRIFFPAFAVRAAPWVRKASIVVLLAAFLPIVIAKGPEMVRLVGNGTLASIAAVVLIGLAGGHLLGGPDRQDRASLAVAASSRHPGLAIMLGTDYLHDRTVPVAVLLYMLVGMGIGTLYARWVKRPPPSDHSTHIHPDLRSSRAH